MKKTWIVKNTAFRNDGYIVSSYGGSQGAIKAAGFPESFSYRNKGGYNGTRNAIGKILVFDDGYHSDYGDKNADFILTRIE